MDVAFDCRPAPGAVNEDLVLASSSFVVVLDGATCTAESTGCIHDVPWLVNRLGAHLHRRLATGGDRPLRELLAAAIVGLREEHEHTCDLSHPDSPSSTVAILRRRGDQVDCLSLADSAVAVERRDGTVEVVLDDRTARLVDCRWSDLPRLRNSDEGFWVASTRPEAADRAVVATFPLADLHRAALVTDGVSRLVERFGWSWSELLAELDLTGPSGVVDAVRKAESAADENSFRGKRHDDATAAVCRFETAPA